MTPGTISADADAAQDAELLARLCDVSAAPASVGFHSAKARPFAERKATITRPVIFPVRHHSPVCAALLAELIEQIRPAAVLIEGPSDYNPHFDELLLDHELPIAIYSYFRDAGGEHRGAYYPFCEYSPEWSALTAARRQGAVVRFIDLPWADVADVDRTSHRYADAELRRGRYVRVLCERLGVEDFDDLWDKLIEAEPKLDLAEYLRRVHSLCYHIRDWEDSVSQSDRRREAFMAGQVRAALDEFAGPVLVVTGGFHSAAIAARLEGYACPGVDEPVHCEPGPATQPERGIALTPWSYERLDSLTGYESGMPSPGFYDFAWQQRQRGEPFSHRPLLTKLARALRERKQVVSTADLIAVETSAHALAALRGRGHVWRRDLVDAVTMALIKDELEYGCASPFVDAVHAVLRGERRGRLADDTRLPPLVHDIKRRLAEAGLELSRGVREIELDLLQAADLARSRLMHGLQVLGVAGYKQTGGTDFLARDDLTRLWEAWRLHWSPEFEATCIEAARYGTSLDDAVAARMVELSSSGDRTAANAAALLVQAAQAGVQAVSAPLLEELERLIRQESQFAGAAEALGHMLYLYCFDEAFGTANLARLGTLVAETFTRTLWLLESLGQSSAEEGPLVEGMRVLLETFHRTAGSLDLNRDEFTAVLARVESDAAKPAQVRGGAAGMLWTLGAATPEQVLAHLLLFSNPNHLGDFLTGLFVLAREVAQRHPQLVKSLDRLLLEFGAEEFQQALPSLRLAFTYFTPREKHYMLTTLFESLGLRDVKPLAELAVDEQTAAAALVLEERLFADLEKFGLIEP